MDNTSFAPGNNSINNSVPPPAPQYSVSERKHLPKIIALVVLFLAFGLSVYAGILYWQEQQLGEDYTISFTPRPSATVEPTADWKTYTNTQYGLTLKYPNSFNIVEGSSNFFSARDASLWMVLQANNPGSGGIQIYNPVTKTVTLNGITVSYKTGKVLEMGSSTPGAERAWVGNFSHGGDSFDFIFRSSDGVDFTQLVDQILSTFKFTR